MLLSGGIDSATALYLSIRSSRVRALTFLYHGMAQREVASARSVGAEAGVVEHRFVRLPDLKEAGDMGLRFGGLPPTYIPLRNSIFYSFAASYAEEVGAASVIGGHNRDDAQVFDDVSPSFFRALEAAFKVASPNLRKERFAIRRPLKAKSKPQVIRLAVKLGAPLRLTWSCHRDGGEHCWKCEGCLSRMKAFKAAEVPDPLASSGGGKLLKQ